MYIGTILLQRQDMQVQQCLQFCAQDRISIQCFSTVS